MVKAFVVYGLLLVGLLFLANTRGWALSRWLDMDNWGSTRNGVYYHGYYGGGFYHK